MAITATALKPLHILVLTGRRSTANLDVQVERWTADGHEVTVLAGGMRAAWTTWRGAGDEADVVVEVVDGRSFFTPFWRWLAAPRVLFVPHVDQHRGRVGAFVFDRLPLALLYRGTPVLTDSDATRAHLLELGVLREHLHVVFPGADGEIDVLRLAAGADSRVRLRDALASSETAKASGLAVATLGNNAIQLLFTVIFTRILGASGYGGLAALVSAFLILLVAGSAVQVAAARDTVLGGLGEGHQLAETIASWTRRLVLAFVIVSVASALLRHPLADLIGVPEHQWAAAAILPTGVLWMGVSLQRGILQGLHAYGPVGKSIVAEGVGRLFFGLILVGAGASVTGAFLGTPLTLAAVGVWLAVVLRRRTGRGVPGVHSPHSLTSLARGNWGPLLGLTLLAVLQNIDVIVVKHQLGGDRAGSYAAAAVAAKTVVWVAIGIGLHLLPEATRRAAAGLDPRPVLLRALRIAAVVAVPALLIFAAVPHLVLKVAFGEKLTQASSALVLLGAAMTLLAVAYLTVQYMIALGNRSFLWVLGVVALVEPLLLTSGNYSIFSFAAIVFGLQCVAAGGVLALGLRRRLAHA